MATAGAMTMRGYFGRLPLFVLLVGLSALAMFVPATVAATLEDFATGRAFFYPALLILILAGIAGFVAPSMRKAALEVPTSSRTWWPGNR